MFTRKTKTTASILSGFAQQVADLEAVAAREDAEMVHQSEIIAEARNRRNEALRERTAARRAAAKIAAFLED